MSSEGYHIKMPSAGSGDVVWGPGATLRAGEYKAVYFCKVTSNSSSNDLVTLDVYSATKGSTFNSRTLKPNEFGSSDTWELKGFTFTVEKTYTDVEVRINNFQTGITDFYCDYIGIVFSGYGDLADITGDLDDISDGSTYGKVKQTALTTGDVDLDKSGVTGTAPVSKLDSTIAAKAVAPLFYEKIKEYSDSPDSETHLETVWGNNAYTRTISAESYVRYRIKQIAGEMKGGAEYSFCDSYILLGSETLSGNRSPIAKDASDMNSWWNVTGLGSALYDFQMFGTAPNTIRRTPIAASAIDGAVVYATSGTDGNRWKIYRNYLAAAWETNDFSSFDTFLIQFDNEWGIDVTVRVRICSDTGETNTYYFDETVSSGSYKYVAKKFSDMSTTGSPNLSSIQRISIECTTTLSGSAADFNIGFFAIANRIYTVDKYNQTAYVEFEHSMNVLGSTNSDMKVAFCIGCYYLHTVYVQNPSSDVRCVSYLEDVA